MEYQYEKILVAGATGYLGKYVVREFKQQGFWVLSLGILWMILLVSLAQFGLTAVMLA